MIELKNWVLHFDPLILSFHLLAQIFISSELTTQSLIKLCLKEQ